MTYCWQKISFYYQTCPTDRNWTTKQKIKLLEWQSVRLASLIPCAVWKKIFLSYNHTPSANRKLLLFIFFLTPGFWNPRTCNQYDTECEIQESYISIQWPVPETNQTAPHAAKNILKNFFIESHSFAKLKVICSYCLQKLQQYKIQRKIKVQFSLIISIYTRVCLNY